jgi:hypothetical protein
MLPDFLFPEAEVLKDGEGPSVSIENAAGVPVQLTLGITGTVEQESLDVAVFGSADGNEWAAKPLAAFPQKFYQGTYTIVADLGQSPDVRFLKVKYKMGRWGHWTDGPKFTFYVFAEPLKA